MPGKTKLSAGRWDVAAIRVISSSPSSRARRTSAGRWGVGAILVAELLVASILVAIVLAMTPRAAFAKGANRLAWIGLARGPISPQRAEALEELLLDELDGYDSFRVVDAGGNAIDDRLLASEASRAAKLFDEGVDHLLNFRHKKALTKLDQAIDVFETRLTPLRDHEILHESLLAKAEALFQSGKSAAAMETLKSLAALSPKRVPSKKTHPAKFVALYERALEEVQESGRLEIQAQEPACAITVDGKPLGAAPVEIQKLAPGKHYVVARWAFAMQLQNVQVAPGRDVRIELRREGPSEEARMAMLDAINARAGAEAAIGHAKRIADLSASDDTLIAALRNEGGTLYLMLARHDADGRPEAIVRMPMSESVDSELTSAAVRKLGVVLFVDRRTGELELGTDGEARPASGLLASLYGRGAGATSVEPAAPAERPKEPPPLAVTEKPKEELPRAVEPREPPNPPAAASATTSPVSADDDDSPLTKRWWFWAGVGAAFVGLAVVGGAIAFRPEPSSTTLVITRE